MRTTVRVSYESKPLVKFPRPAELRETYAVEHGSRFYTFEGTATYRNFRQFTVTTHEQIRPIRRAKRAMRRQLETDRRTGASGTIRRTSPNRLQQRRTGGELGGMGPRARPVPAATSRPYRGVSCPASWPKNTTSRTAIPRIGRSSHTWRLSWLVRAADEGYVPYRDVFEVDGQPRATAANGS